MIPRAYQATLIPEPGTAAYWMHGTSFEEVTVIAGKTEATVMVNTGPKRGKIIEIPLSELWVRRVV